MKPFIVASTRPELIKLSPVMRELEARGIGYIFVTTGQHYDEPLFDRFISDLELREPDYDVEVGSGSQAYQTSLAMMELEKLMAEEKPDVVVAEGDTNSVLSSALAAVKLHIPFAHVEAGLRSFDKRMPEEVNRILADHCSELLFAPTDGAGLNLINEGIFPDKIFIVGNTIVDATLQNLKLANKMPSKLPEGYLLLTLHRAENVDKYEVLSGIVDALIEIKQKIIFPVHPRTKKMLEKFKLIEKLKKGNISIVEPMGYLDFLNAMSSADLVLTDSGGIQEEAVTLKVPCLTLRTTTERPESVDAGGNILAGVKKEDILEKLQLILGDRKLYDKMKQTRNPFGDGKAGKRIVDILVEKHDKDELRIPSPDFTKGFWKKRFVEIDSELDGKRIRELDFMVLRVIDKSEERFPHSDMKLKKGQMIELIS
ncbi:MAG: UDP-N-acetylglucosamine 2-epimerase (non-hydrolyzing) [Candidatus Hydrothermarchaeales archaeon]